MVIQLPQGKEQPLRLAANITFAVHVLQYFQLKQLLFPILTKKIHTR